MTTKIYVIRQTSTQQTLDRVDLEWSLPELPQIGDVIGFEPSEEPADLYGYRVVDRIWFTGPQPQRPPRGGAGPSAAPDCRLQIRAVRTYDPPADDPGYVAPPRDAPRRARRTT